MSELIRTNVAIPGHPELRGRIFDKGWLGYWLYLDRKGRWFWSNIAQSPLRNITEAGIRDATHWALVGRSDYELQEQAKRDQAKAAARKRAAQLPNIKGDA